MDVAHVAKLAALPLAPGEEQKLQAQFEETLKTVDLINQLDTSSITPTSQVTGLINITRPDVIDTSRILQPPQTNNGYFVVPAIYVDR